MTNPLQFGPRLPTERERAESTRDGLSERLRQSRLDGPRRRTPGPGSSQEAVQWTAYEALTSRQSCASLKYIHDPYSLWHPSWTQSAPALKPPIINRGTYVRFNTIRADISRFLEAGGRQVISLGCGMDTRYMLAREEREPGTPTEASSVAAECGPDAYRESEQISFWGEIDFAEVTAEKIRWLKSQPKLMYLVTSGNVDEALVCNMPFLPSDLQHSCLQHMVLTTFTRSH